jgi:hypothetical protein
MPDVFGALEQKYFVILLFFVVFVRDVTLARTNCRATVGHQVVLAKRSLQLLVASLPPGVSLRSFVDVNR